jgi:hypothetical protein
METLGTESTCFLFTSGNRLREEDFRPAKAVNSAVCGLHPSAMEHTIVSAPRKGDGNVVRCRDIGVDHGREPGQLHHWIDVCALV